MRDNWTYGPVPASYSFQSPISDISFVSYGGGYSLTSEPPSDYSTTQTVSQDVAKGVQQMHITDDPEFRSSLKSRGKGAYQCPHGMDCTKGGVGRNGELVVFRRNCDFR